MIRSREDDYFCMGVNLLNIRNRNEKRIIRAMPDILEEYPEYSPSSIDIRDIYALALNSLQPRYVQLATIVLREPVNDEDIMNSVRGAVERVMKNPSFPGFVKTGRDALHKADGPDESRHEHEEKGL